MSLSAIRTGIAATLTACGPFSASEISACSFDVMTNTAPGGCSIVLLPGPQANFVPESQGSGCALNYERSWQVHGTLYVQDTGDPATFYARVWQAHDDLYNTLAKDVSLQGALGANGIGYLTRIAYNDRMFQKVSGRLFAAVDFWVTGTEV